MKTVLVVDDEAKIRDVITSYLQNEGYRSLEAQDGKEALHLMTKVPFDLIILDLMLPDMTGEQVCQKIREQSPVPVLMLTAKVAEDDRITGLSLGADDYVIKPFSPRELMARVKALLRRANEQDLLADRISFNNDELIIDSIQKEITVNGSVMSLTPNEYRLLLVLARHPGRTFSREELIEKVLGYDFEGEIRTIDQHIKNLRQKIEKDPRQPRYIVTIFGTGYRFPGGSRC